MDRLRQLTPDLIRRRYALKFGIALLALGLSVAVIGYGGTILVEADTEDRLTTDAGNAAAQEAEKFETWNENNQLTAETVSRSAPVTGGDTDAIADHLSQRVLELPIGAQEIHYVDVEDGEIAASSNDERIGQSLEDGDEPWVSTAADPTEDVAISTVYEGQQDGEPLPMIAYTTQVNDDPDHAIVYTVNMHAYAANIQQTDDQSVTLVVDGDDRVIADEYNANILEEYDTDGPTEQARSGGPTNPGSMTVTPTALFESDEYPVGTDEDHLVGYAQVRNSDWVIVTHTPESEALGFVAQIRSYGLYATLLGVLLIGAVGAILGRNTAVSIDRLTDRAEKMEHGDLDVDLETSRIDNIGRLYQGFDLMRDALRDQIEEAEAARAEAERERERVVEINDHLEAKAAEYRSVMGAAADGDLTARADVESENETMEGIGVEFNQMLDELEETVAHVAAFATEVAAATEEVTASSEEVQSASQQVTESTQEIADGADRQHERFRVASSEIESLSTTTEQIAASSNEVADLAERTADAGTEGRISAQAVIEGLDRIEADSDEAVEEIKQLEAEMAQIDELVELISEIAEETNMLALNANIEASRSGAGDEGFSVVATEVKELSAKTKETVTNIETRLDRLQEQTEDAVDVVTTTRERVDENRAVIEETVDSLDEIADYAQQTNTGVQEISAATEEQAASTQEVVTVVDEAATISAETTAESETVAAAAEEQTTALSEVSESANALASRARSLSATIDRFEVTDSIDHPDDTSDTQLSDDVPGSNASVLDNDNDSLDAVMGTTDSPSRPAAESRAANDIAERSDAELDLEPDDEEVFSFGTSSADTSETPTDTPETPTDTEDTDEN